MTLKPGWRWDKSRDRNWLLFYKNETLYAADIELTPHSDFWSARIWFTPGTDDSFNDYESVEVEYATIEEAMEDLENCVEPMGE